MSGGIRTSDQRPMHDQVSVAPDWRGEMGIAAQSQAEMAYIVRAIDGLRLAAKDQLVDESSCRRCRGAPQHPIEKLSLQRLSLSKALPDDRGLGEQSAQLLNLLGVGRVVNTVHAGLPPCLQILRGGDVRHDHE